MVQETFPQHAYVHEGLQHGERNGRSGRCQERVSHGEMKNKEYNSNLIIASDVLNKPTQQKSWVGKKLRLCQYP